MISFDCANLLCLVIIREVAKKKSSNVPEQLRGFLAQETRMASLLMEASDGSVVSLEKLDDIAVEKPDNQVLAVQSKDCRKTNPVSDKSVQMWKTFANWVREVRENRLKASNTLFEIYVSRKVTGKLVALFAGATSPSTAREAFEKARDLLWGKPPDFSKKQAVAETLRPHLEEVFGLSPNAFQAIIQRFQLTCALKSPEGDLYQLVRDKLPFEEDDIITEVSVQVCGWVKILVAEQLRQGQPAVIRAEDFWRNLKGSYSKMRPGGMLPDLGGKGPSPAEVARLMNANFVSQMNIIEVESESLKWAMTCLFKARAARTKWSSQGKALVNEEDISEFEDGLKHAWRNLKIEVFSDPLRTEEKLRGRILLAKCESHKCKVEQKIVPEYFIPGCYHDLADNLSVGWHPNFETLLAKNTP